MGKRQRGKWSEVFWGLENRGMTDSLNFVDYSRSMRRVFWNLGNLMPDSHFLDVAFIAFFGVICGSNVMPHYIQNISLVLILMSLSTISTLCWHATWKPIDNLCVISPLLDASFWYLFLIGHNTTCLTPTVRIAS